MRKQIVIVVALVGVAFVALGLLGTGQAVAKGPDGKKLYKDYCRPCHGAKSPHGDYQPLSLIQDQWNRFFDKKLVKTHTDVSVPGQEDKKLLEFLTEEDLKKIRAFTVDHAADSESPMTCG